MIFSPKILKDEPIDPDFDVRRLAEETEGYSGSDLQALCETAARAPIRDHLRNARVSESFTN